MCINRTSFTRWVSAYLYAFFAPILQMVKSAHRGVAKGAMGACPPIIGKFFLDHSVGNSNLEILQKCFIIFIYYLLHVFLKSTCTFVFSNPYQNSTPGPHWGTSVCQTSCLYLVVKSWLCLWVRSCGSWKHYGNGVGTLLDAQINCWWHIRIRCTSVQASLVWTWCWGELCNKKKSFLMRM